jgi:hypothetical protein
VLLDLRTPRLFVSTRASSGVQDPHGFAITDDPSLVGVSLTARPASSRRRASRSATPSTCASAASELARSALGFDGPFAFGADARNPRHSARS